jgi:hypothetical protein
MENALWDADQCDSPRLKEKMVQILGARPWIAQEPGHDPVPDRHPEVIIGGQDHDRKFYQGQEINFLHSGGKEGRFAAEDVEGGD